MRENPGMGMVMGQLAAEQAARLDAQTKLAEREKKDDQEQMGQMMATAAKEGVQQALQTMASKFNADNMPGSAAGPCLAQKSPSATPQTP